MRWTVRKAAAELDLHPQTMAKRLKAAGLDPKKGRTFHTSEIFRAVMGDLDAERVRETRERANLLELERAELERRLVRLDEVQAAIGTFAPTVRQELLRAPSSLASRCNPESPAIAREQLQAWVDHLLGRLRQAITLALEKFADGPPAAERNGKHKKPKAGKQESLKL